MVRAEFGFRIKKRRPAGRLNHLLPIPLLLLGLCGGAYGLFAVAVHVDVVQQLAALVNVHLRVNVANMRLRGVGTNHEFV